MIGDDDVARLRVEALATAHVQVDPREPDPTVGPAAQQSVDGRGGRVPTPQDTDDGGVDAGADQTDRHNGPGPEQFGESPHHRRI